MMSNPFKLIIALCFLTPSLLSLTGCGGCGFDCDNEDGNTDPATMSLGISGSTSNDIKEAVITVDKITFVRSNAANVVVDTFTSDDLDITDEETFQIDLTEYLGKKQVIVIKDPEFKVATYDNIVLTLKDNDMQFSWVLDVEDKQFKLNVSDDHTLTVDGIKTTSKNRTFTIKLSLAQSLFYDSDKEEYFLTDKGSRVMDNSMAAVIQGKVDDDLFDTNDECAETKNDNRLYLYKGINLNTNNLKDVYTDSTAPADAIHPFDAILPSASTQNDDWDYAFAYLPAGDYTMVFTCDAELDDPVEYENLRIPFPISQVYKFTLEEGDDPGCFIDENANC
jgi:Domain of unknown function (DUF4382)